MKNLDWAFFSRTARILQTCSLLNSISRNTKRLSVNGFRNEGRRYEHRRRHDSDSSPEDFKRRRHRRESSDGDRNSHRRSKHATTYDSDNSLPHEEDMQIHLEQPDPISDGVKKLKEAVKEYDSESDEDSPEKSVQSISKKEQRQKRSLSPEEETKRLRRSSSSTERKSLSPTYKKRTFREEKRSISKEQDHSKEGKSKDVKGKPTNADEPGGLHRFRDEGSRRSTSHDKTNPKDVQLKRSRSPNQPNTKNERLRKSRSNETDPQIPHIKIY